MALSILTMFVTYGRPSEVVPRSLEDGLISPATNTQKWAVLMHPSERGEQSETGASNESVMIDSQQVSWLGLVLGSLKSAKQTRPPFTFRYHELVATWESIIKMMKSCTRATIQAAMRMLLALSLCRICGSMWLA